ncbi:MAG: sodium-coupled permease, partial [Planctomycetaceae bacterium]|nr:sodium-coupled permease [Planctomycetaceae bacterium]
LAYPGEMVKNGPMLFAQLAAYPFIMIVVCLWLIPAIMKQKNVTSGYELLEQRLGLIGRLQGAGMFVLLRIVWMASILYATTDKVIVPLFNIDRSWNPGIAIVLGTLTIIYTSLGGIRAVVITDALQSLIMFVGAIITVCVVTYAVGGVDNWFPHQWYSHWAEPIFWFRTDVRATFMGALLNMFVWMTCTAGSDQMAIQRYLSTRDITAARRSFTVHMATELFMSLILAAVGLAVLGYFTAFPEIFAQGVSPIDSADELFPRFVVVGLPAGLTGLVIAAILSAAMSSLSSGMNSTSAVIVSDFIDRFRHENLSDRAQVSVSRFVSILMGIIAIFLSMIVGHLTDNLVELCIKVVNLLTSPIFVLFFLALFVPWVKPRGGIAATIVSTTVAVSIAFFNVFKLEMLWTAPCALVTGIAAGCLFSLPITPTNRNSVS